MANGQLTGKEHTKWMKFCTTALEMLLIGLCGLVLVYLISPCRWGFEDSLQPVDWYKVRLWMAGIVGVPFLVIFGTWPLLRFTK